MNRTEELPQKGELWLCYHESQNPESDESRLSVVECLGESDGKLGELHRQHLVGTPYRARYLWEADYPEFNGDIAEALSNWMFHTRLADDADDYDDEYHALLDYVRGYLTNREILELITGSSLHSGGRTGRDALRFFALDGVHKSITENSISHGHGPSRYASTVEYQIERLPNHLRGIALESEQDRWEGSLGFDEYEAGFVVEILILRNELMDEDNDTEIKGLVNEFDLEYDEYREEEI